MSVCPCHHLGRDENKGLSNSSKQTDDLPDQNLPTISRRAFVKTTALTASALAWPASSYSAVFGAKRSNSLLPSSAARHGHGPLEQPRETRRRGTTSRSSPFRMFISAASHARRASARARAIRLRRNFSNEKTSTPCLIATPDHGTRKFPSTPWTPANHVYVENQ